VSIETLAELYEQLATERSRDALATLERRCLHPERAEAALSEMAAALEDAAAVLTLLARDCKSLAHVREAMLGEAATLVTLAGRLEEAADLGRR
jgi:hypothetical protein